MNQPKRIESNPYQFVLEENTLHAYGENEYILIQLEKLPKDFLDMTLLDIDGTGSIYVFSRIEDFQYQHKWVKGAVYRKQ